MKIRFKGSKSLMTITIPVGAPKGLVKSHVDFTPGAVVDLSDSDGAKLLELDKHGHYEKVDLITKTEVEQEEETLPEPTKQVKRGRPRKS